MAVATQSRTRFVVALNADVVGYSRLMADDFEGTAAIVADYHRLVEEKVEAAGGTLVVFVGDNFMAVFEHATDAMAAAIAISTEIEGRNADLPEHRRVRFRMGLDQGEVTITPDGQYYGDVLNIAARIQALAVPGGVSVSGDVYRALDEPELRFKPSGQRTLKNIPGAVPVYDFRDLPVEGPAGRKRPILATPSVAVLPIHVEWVEESLRGAGPILAADLVDRLTAIPGLRVVDATDETQTIENQHAIDYMLNSGIHQFGESLRVYVKLMDFATINVVFSRRWDATADTLLTLSDSIGEEVARFLEVELVVGEPARIYSDLGDPKAQENIYRGWFQLNSSTREGFQRALEYFEEVDQHHPDETVAAALLAFTHWVGVAQDLVDDPEHHLQLSKEYARRGIAEGDPSGLSQMAEAAVLIIERRFAEAAERLEGVEITRPTCDVTFGLEGSSRRYLGQWEKSIEALDRAMRLTQVVNPWYPTVQACAFFIGGRFEDAVAAAEAVLEQQPHNLEALLVLTAAQQEMGLERRARATAQIVKDTYPALDVEAWVAERPYQDPELIERWRRVLGEVGLI
jgi:adenylate cyclase